MAVFRFEKALPMNFEHSDKVSDHTNIWREWSRMEALKDKARAEGLWNLFTLNRFVRIADGPDEVHMSQLGKSKIKEYVAMNER